MEQAAWRPLPVAQFAFPRSLSPAPTPSSQAQLEQLRKTSSSSSSAAAGGANGATSGTASPKPVGTGAYRPPGLRNREIPSIFKREDEGGLPYTPLKSNGTEKSGIPGMTSSSVPGAGAGRGRGRTVPGAAPRTDSNEGGQKKGNQKKNKQQQQQGQQQQNRRQTDGLAEGVDNLRVQDAAPTAEAAAPAVESTPSAPSTPMKSALNGVSSAQDQANSVLTPEDKKRRALQKKLGAIEQLKARRAAGEKLEKTQEKKIEAEDEVKKELAELG
jgi:translation initiation factor 2A